jgi:hypothetical protein
LQYFLLILLLSLHTDAGAAEIKETIIAFCVVHFQHSTLFTDARASATKEAIIAICVAHFPSHLRTDHEAAATRRTNCNFCSSFLPPPYLQTLDQLQQKELVGKRLQEDLGKLSCKFGVVRHQMGLLYEDFAREREEWRGERDRLEEERGRLEEAAESGRAKVEEYESHLQAITAGERLAAG